MENVVRRALTPISAPKAGDADNVVDAIDDYPGRSDEVVKFLTRDVESNLTANNRVPSPGSLLWTILLSRASSERWSSPASRSMFYERSQSGFQYSGSHEPRRESRLENRITFDPRDELEQPPRGNTVAKAK